MTELKVYNHNKRLESVVVDQKIPEPTHVIRFDIKEITKLSTDYKLKKPVLLDFKFYNIPNNFKKIYYCDQCGDEITPLLLVKLYSYDSDSWPPTKHICIEISIDMACKLNTEGRSDYEESTIYYNDNFINRVSYILYNSGKLPEFSDMDYINLNALLTHHYICQLNTQYCKQCCEGRDYPILDFINNIHVNVKPLKKYLDKLPFKQLKTDKLQKKISQNGKGYYPKYIKYKSKYLQLKNK